MNKRFISMMTMLILSVFFSISASAYDVMVDGIGYNIVTKAKTAEVTKGDNEYSGDVTIPETITVDNVVYKCDKYRGLCFRRMQQPHIYHNSKFSDKYWRGSFQRMQWPHLIHDS